MYTEPGTYNPDAGSEPQQSFSGTQVISDEETQSLKPNALSIETFSHKQSIE
jgi:hypothetical protein